MFQKVRKVIGTLFLLTAVIITQIPSQNASAYNADFQLNGTTLVKYTGTEQSVSVPDTVKKIGEDAFSDCDTMEEVSLPAALEEIAYNAFSNCDNLKSVQIPDNVTSIGNAAFSGCTSLEEVTLGDGLTQFGTGVFAGCTKLQTLSVSNDRFSFENGVLYDDEQTIIYEMLPGRESNLYTMPSTVEEISPYAFWGCENLQTLVISENVKEISPYAFGNCTQLTALEIPYSVNSIQMKAFADCVNLEGIYVPESVSYIHDTAFDGCNQLQAETEDGTYAAVYFAARDVSDITRAEYEDILDTILLNAVPEPEPTEDEDNSGDTNGTNSTTGTDGENSDDEENSDGGENSDDGESSDDADGDASGNGEDDSSDEIVGYEYYDDPNALGTTRIVAGDAVFFIDNTKQGVYDGSEYQPPQVQDDDTATVPPTQQEEYQEIIFGTEDSKGISFPKYTIVNQNLIANQAYYLNTELTEYEIPDTIQTIGEFAFARSSLESIEIPESVMEIGYGAFYHCDYLSEVSIPESVTEIEPYAFANTRWLEQWQQYSTDTFLIVGDGILLAYKGTRSNVVLPDTVKRIAPQAFKDHTEITAVALNDELLVIGEEAFAGCTSLSIVTGGKEVQEIRDRAFESCPLTAARIPGNVQSVGLGAYANEQNTQTEDDFAVFQSMDLPSVSYESSAQRLSNEEYRQLVFDGVDIAVISNSITPRMISGTVLDPSELGFRGLAISIQTDATDAQEGTVALRLCTKLPDANGIIQIPSSYEIYGRQYRLIQIDETAFDYYKENQALAECGVTEVILPDSFAAQSTQLLASILPQESSATEDIEVPEEQNLSEDITTQSETAIEAPVSEPQIKLTIQSNSLKNQEVIQASIEGTDEKLQLFITERDETSLAIQNAYETLYGPTDFSNVVGLDLTMTDETGTIQITRLGRNGMSIIIPVPISTNAENIHMMCLDENGQLEAINHTLVEVNGLPCIQFTVTHFSPYAVYEFAEGAGPAGSQTNGTQLDDSPDTGDLMEPKWFLALAAAAVGILLLAWKSKWLSLVNTKQKKIHTIK